MDGESKFLSKQGILQQARRINLLARGSFHWFVTFRSFYRRRARSRNQFPLNRATEAREHATRPSSPACTRREWRPGGRAPRRELPGEFPTRCQRIEQVKAISVCFVQRKYRVSASPAGNVASRRVPCIRHHRSKRSRRIYFYLFFLRNRESIECNF